MSTTAEDPREVPAKAFQLLPLIRHVSRAITPVLVRSPLSPNQITLAALACGLASAWCFSRGTTAGSVWGAFALVACYVLDNADGEVARIRSQCTRAGAFLDTVVDAVVHTVFFAALGIGVYRATGESFWLWCGWAATFGSFVNSAVSLPRVAREIFSGTADQGDEGELSSPDSFREHLMFALRALSRANFCIIVAVLAAFDVIWILLPCAAIGAQVYWVMGLSSRAERYHV